MSRCYYDLHFTDRKTEIQSGHHPNNFNKKKNIKSKNFFKKKENKIVLYLHFPASACPLSYFDI